MWFTRWFLSYILRWLLWFVRSSWIAVLNFASARTRAKSVTTLQYRTVNNLNIATQYVPRLASWPFYITIQTSGLSALRFAEVGLYDRKHPAKTELIPPASTQRATVIAHTALYTAAQITYAAKFLRCHTQKSFDRSDYQSL